MPQVLLHGSAPARRWAVVACASAFATILVAPVGTAIASSPCDTKLQSLVDATTTGGVLRLPACIYEEKITITRPITLDGQWQAEIRGSDVWTGWSAGPSTWTSVNSLPVFPHDTQAICLDPRCDWPEQVFVDGTPLTQLAPGSLP